MSGVLFLSPAFGAGVGLNPAGINFPDGTYQNTAALPPLPDTMTWVAPSGGDYTSPVDAMNHLADWCAPASYGGLTHLCTLMIAPGEYDLGGNQLVMHAGVDIVGMGVGVTHLRGQVTSSTPGESSALVLGNTYAMLRDLSVHNYGNDSFVAIYNNKPHFRIERVGVSVSSGLGGGDSYGIINEADAAVFKDIDVYSHSSSASNTCYGIWNKGNGQLEINRARVEADGCDSDNTAIQNNGTSLRLAEVDASAACFGSLCAHGVWSSSGVVVVKDSKLEGAAHSLGVASGSAKIINTQLDGNVTGPPGSIQCWGTYDNNLAAVGC
jgi:hypothetical protein